MKKRPFSRISISIGLPSVLAVIKCGLALICVAFPAAQAQALIHYRVNDTDNPAKGVPNLGILDNGEDQRLPKFFFFNLTTLPKFSRV